MRVEERAETVAGRRRRWGRHPILVEERVAYEEQQSLLPLQAGHGQAEGIGRRVENGGLTARKLLAGFGASTTDRAAAARQPVATNKGKRTQAKSLPGNKFRISHLDLDRLTQQLLAVGRAPTLFADVGRLVDTQHVTREVDAKGFLQLAQFFGHGQFPFLKFLQ